MSSGSTSDRLNKTSTLVTNNLGLFYFTRMQKLSSISIVRIVKRGLLNPFLNFSLSFFLSVHVKPTLQLVNYKCNLFINLTPVYQSCEYSRGEKRLRELI